MPSYGFATLDPRNIPAATEANDKVFANAVYGIEVTVPALAKRCTSNLDPQHNGGDTNRAAIEDSLTIELPAEGSTLATVRADLDAIGSMAILNLRAKGESLESAMGRIAMVAASDKFARGGWPGPKPLPTRDNPWIEETATAESSRPLAAIGVAVMDFKVPLTDRVSTMERWLLTGEEPQQYRNQVEKERLDMIVALETGQIKFSVRQGAPVCRGHGYYNYCLWCGEDFISPSAIAVVISTHRAATSVGYSLAPVVVALNPEFRLRGGEPHKKFTVCQFAGGYVDLKAVLAELNELEQGWGGSPTIGGSPQGVSSRLTIDEVVAVVEKHLK